MFSGSIVALVTPMLPTGEIDEKSLQRLVEHHIEQGTQGIVVAGTTGESATLSEDEKHRVIMLVLKTARKRIPIIAGTGTASTTETIQRTQKARDLGVDACLILTPYNVRPSQEGLFQHFRAIAEKVAVPIIIYNVPKRTGCDILPDTIQRLLPFSNIVGVKEATGDLKRCEKLLKLSQNKLDLLSGDDETAFDFILLGGKGVISVTANVAPKLMQDLCKAALTAGIENVNLEKGRKINAQLMPLHKNLFLESNPIPVKWALAEMGVIQNYIRLPLTQLAPQYQLQVNEALRLAGIK